MATTNDEEIKRVMDSGEDLHEWFAAKCGCKDRPIRRKRWTSSYNRNDYDDSRRSMMMAAHSSSMAATSSIMAMAAII